MKQYSIPELKKEFTRLGYTWFNFQFIGIRSKANLPNQFDDLFGVVDGDRVTWYSCTTNPGTHWLKNLLNKNGTALLKPNQYVNTWKLGLHQGKYEAFVQCKPVTVYRDADMDEVAEETIKTETGMFGINIHRANETVISKIIDKWSAGCQVLNNPADFKWIKELAKSKKQPEFTYTLLREF
jgi:hypothetical protein